MADIEVLVSPELVGAFCEVVLDFPMQALIPRINVCSYRKFEELKKKDALPLNVHPVFIGCGSRLGQMGTTIAYSLAHGRGLLPTVQWFRENIFGKRTLYKKLMTAYLEGKTLVFISPDQIVRSYVFAVMFMKSAKLLSGLDANAALSVAVNHCKSLGYLVQEGGDLFV